MTFKLDSLPSQQGKKAIVTGANTGLGFETALGLAKTGCHVILACRDMDKAAAAATEIRQQIPDANVETMALDLSQLASVKEFATAYRQRHQTLNLLINNAGIMFPPYSQTVDGFESQFCVNYLGHFLLTALLIDLMPDTAESRVVSLSSNAHKFGKINFQDLQSEQNYSATAAYGQSKLACLLFAVELQRRLAAKNKNILSVAAHPGIAPTELGRYIPAFLAGLIRLIFVPFFANSVAQGALPTLMAALDPAATGGDYFGPQGFGEMSGKPGRVEKSDQAKDEAIAKQLWETSETLINCPLTIPD
ncbi:MULTISPECIES: oxidoreductase [Cyanophyceae]|uniref:oxidoreductase n=1 Tax=Cyanophyceae TaxID=3028117 RepID=UPI00016DCCDD|nr:MULTISPECIES: oxidoreductase [Cyanophyceae]ACA99476.1 oxidoreductase, short chain dehydrogenase/reductase family [Picosynechococcus sp. PCC 7002]SMH30587.1 NAD(P)-dependent dehydrogenase, short-chain alcohol dehydrogenase family [Picosynechococcus sp. OG1]SMQ83924.1 NAD(P)-dependent dehydrogenase, short-chain alcohol dehydrogenase family [Synechococcus sp. 7002]